MVSFIIFGRYKSVCMFTNCCSIQHPLDLIHCPRKIWDDDPADDDNNISSSSDESDDVSKQTAENVQQFIQAKWNVYWFFMDAMEIYKSMSPLALAAQIIQDSLSLKTHQSDEFRLFQLNQWFIFWIWKLKFYQHVDSTMKTKRHHCLSIWFDNSV